jgi:hypothetical protein
MSNVYLLDRNVVSLIKYYNAKGRPRDREKRIFLNHLERLDRGGNFISPLIAINEGQRSAPESAEEFRVTARDESAAVGKFFRFARTDADFFHVEDVLQPLINGLLEPKFDQYVEFLKDVSPLAIQPQAAGKRLERCIDVINRAKQTGIPACHVIVVAVLSATYGNRSSIAILNPRIKGDKAYNAANDLMVISRLCRMQAADFSRRMNYIFITMDKNLRIFHSFFSNVGGAYLGHEVGGELVRHSVSLSIHKNIFTQIQDAEWITLQELLLEPDSKLYEA